MNILQRFLCAGLLLGLSSAPAISTANPLGAALVQPDATTKLHYEGGIVNGNGTINQGSKYTVTHTGTGQYTIVFPNGSLAGCPAMTVNAFGVPGRAATGLVYGEGCSNGGATFTVELVALDGSQALQDNAFQFTMVVAK